MRGKKSIEQRINLSWNTTEEIYQISKFVGPMYGYGLHHFPAYCCKKWLHNPIYEIPEKARPRCVTAYVDAELKSSLNQASASYHFTCSEIIYVCVKREVYAQVTKWGCKTPQEFVKLMISENPLEILAQVISDLNIALVA